MSIRVQPRPPVGVFSFLAVVLLAVGVSACGGGAPAGGGSIDPGATGGGKSGAPTNGRSSDGRSEASVRRIVSLAPNITEILFALGLGNRVVGVTEFCNYPPEALKISKVGGFVNPNAEVILALHPDLVVATPNVGNRTFVERLMAVGARVEVVQARNVEEIFPAIASIAKAAGVEPAGRDLVARLRADIDRETARVASLPRRKTLFCLQIEPLVVAGPGSYPGDLIALAGGENIVPASAGAYPTYSLESVVSAAPETIVQSLMDTRSGASGAEPLLAYWRRLATIPAVAKQQVFTVPGDVVLRPGPRVAEGVAALIALIHPEAAARASTGGEPAPRVASRAAHGEPAPAPAVSR